MKLTLRKAKAIQSSINTAIEAIPARSSVALTEFHDPDEILRNANDILFKNDNRRRSLLSVLYAIRSKAGIMTATSGVSELLAQAAYIDKRISQLEDIAKPGAMLDATVLAGKLNKIKGDTNHYREEVTTSVLTLEQLDVISSQIKSLKRDKQKINDTVLELNIKTEIEIDDTIVKTLTDEGLI